MPEGVLVTGGAGFIGSHLVDGLLSRGHRVRVLDALEPQVHSDVPAAHLNPHAELTVGSVLDRDAVRAALRDVDVVYHQAALVGVGQSMYEVARYCEANTVGAAIVLEEAILRRDRVRKVVVASSMSVYGEGAYRGPAGPVAPSLRPRAALRAQRWDPTDPISGSPLSPVPTPETKPLHPTSVYAVTKRDHEELFLTIGRAYQLPAVALRYFNVYGARQALTNPYTGVAAIFTSRLLNENRPVVYEDGRQTRDFVHVSDVVRANIAAMESPTADYEAINVGTGRPTTILDVARAIARELGKSNLEPEVTSTFREGDIRHCYADITKARDLLGYEPGMSFEMGVREFIEWTASQIALDGFDRANRELTQRGLA